MTQNTPLSREALFEEIAGQNIDEASSKGHDNVEDHFINCAQEVTMTRSELEELSAAGFEKLSANIMHLKNASVAFDLSRENL